MEYVFKIGSFGLRWYSLLIAIGLLVGAFVAYREAKRRGDNPEHVFNALLLALPLALIGARAYHVIHQWGAIYSKDPMRVFLINEGGIGIYGAVAGSVLALFIYTKWNKLNLWRWLDIGAPGLIIGQAIGRWGNYFNQELYGKPTDLPWGIYIDPQHRVPGVENFDKFHPLFLYESLLNLLGFVVMLYVARRFASRLKDGDIALLYFIIYPIVRLSLETLRLDNWHVGSLPTASIISIVSIVVAGGALLYRHWLGPRMRARAGKTAEA